MKITVLANRDLASNIALNYLVSKLKHHNLHLFLSDQVGKQKAKPQPLNDLKSVEQFLFNDIVFHAVDGQPPSETKYLTFEGLARVIDNPISTLNNINEPEGLAQLTATQPDLVLSIRFGKILKDKAIAIPPLGVLNLHSGLLPQYQGVMATFWAMYNQENDYGTTLHFIDSAAIDAGPIISEQRHQLDLNKSYLENVIDLYRDGCQAMVDASQRLSEGLPLKSQQQTGKAEYYSFPSESQLNEFMDRGLRLFDSQHIMSLAKAYQGVE